jgi:hypothetical protein
MTRVRPRKYGYKVEGVHRRPVGRVRARSKVALLKGQKFGRAGEPRILSPEDRKANRR